MNNFFILFIFLIIAYSLKDFQRSPLYFVLNLPITVCFQTTVAAGQKRFFY